MKASKSDLLSAMGAVIGICGKKSTIPIVNNIVLNTDGGDKFNIRSTDLDIFVTTTYSSENKDTFSVCVSGKDLYEIVKNMPNGDIDLSIKDNIAIVSSGKIKYRLPTRDSGEFPKISTLGNEISVKDIEAKKFLDLLKQTIFSCANDDPRIFLNGIYSTGKGSWVSTDGHRLTLVTNEDITLPAFIIHKRSALEIIKLLENERVEWITISVTPSHISILTPNTNWICRFIDGDFPDYNTVIPKVTSNSVTLNKYEFRDSVKRISILSQERTGGIKVTFIKDSAIIEASNHERGEGTESINVEYNGEEITLGLNSRYLLEVLGIIEGEKITISLTDDVSPIVITSDKEEGFKHVIMPMRVV